MASSLFQSKKKRGEMPSGNLGMQEGARPLTVLIIKVTYREAILRSQIDFNFCLIKSISNQLSFPECFPGSGKIIYEITFVIRKLLN